MPTPHRRPLRPDWISKTLAGAILGFALAVGCSGLFGLLTPGLVMGAKTQLMMWMIFPIWLAVLGGCYLFRSGLRAWSWLGAINLLVLGALLLARAI